VRIPSKASSREVPGSIMLWLGDGESQIIIWVVYMVATRARFFVENATAPARRSFY
jgi:hypothetical protein